MKKALMIVLVAVAGGAIAIGAMAQGAPREKAGDGLDRFFEKNDANDDGKVTLKEPAASAEKLMKELDANEDGAIAKAELSAAMKERESRQDEGDRPEREERRGPPESGQRGGGGGGRPSPDDMGPGLAREVILTR